MSHAEEIRQQDGIHRLRRSMHETEKLKASDVTMYHDGIEILRAEAAEDEQAKLKHGTERWTRQPSRLAAEKLYAQVEKIGGYLRSASSSDELVKGKLKDCESILQILSGTDRDLEDYVPSSRRVTMPLKVEKDAARLRTVLNEVNRLESRRRRKMEALREKAKADDISEENMPPMPDVPLTCF